MGRIPYRYESAEDPPVDTEHASGVVYSVSDCSVRLQALHSAKLLRRFAIDYELFGLLLSGLHNVLTKRPDMPDSRTQTQTTCYHHIATTTRCGVSVVFETTPERLVLCGEIGRYINLTAGIA